MADVDVSVVRFRDSVRFNGTENSVLMRSRDKCALFRIAGGIRAVPQKGAIVIVPDSNIRSIELAEPKADG